MNLKSFEEKWRQIMERYEVGQREKLAEYRRVGLERGKGKREVKPKKNLICDCLRSNQMHYTVQTTKIADYVPPIFDLPSNI